MGQIEDREFLKVRIRAEKLLAEEHTIEYLENVVQTQSHPNFLDESKKCGERKVRLTCCEKVVASLLKIAL